MSDWQSRLKLESCIKTLLYYSPILGYVFHEIDRVVDYKIPTMGVGFIDKEARIALYYNPTFVDMLTEEALIKVILPHECAHIINGHLGRYKADDYKDLNRKFLNIGLDLAVNCEDYVNMKTIGRVDKALQEIFVKEKEKLIEHLKKHNAPQEVLDEVEKKSQEGVGTVTADKYMDKETKKPFPFKQTSDWYLAKLFEQNKGNQSGDGIPMLNGFDDHKFQDSALSQTTQQNLAKQTVAQAYKEWTNNGKQRGHTPDGCIETIEGMLFPKMPITKAFRNLIGSFIGSDFDPSSSRINKRQNSYCSPGKRIKNKLQLCIVFDTSGSMGPKDLELARGLVKKVQREMDPEIFIMHCDAAVQKTETLRGKQIPVKFAGRGGTDFSPVFDWLYQHKMKPDGVIFFTDGCGALETDKAGRYRILWALTPGGQEYNFMHGPRMRILKLGEFASE